MSCFVTTNPTSPHIEEETYDAYQTHLWFAEKTQKSILHCWRGWLEWHSFKLFPGNHFVIESAVWKLC